MVEETSGQTVRVETVIRAEDQILEVLCSTPYDFTDSSKSLREHATELKSDGGSMKDSSAEEFWSDLRRTVSGKRQRELEERLEELHGKMEHVMMMREEMSEQISSFKRKTRDVEDLLSDVQALKSNLRSSLKEYESMKSARGDARKAINDWIESHVHLEGFGDHIIADGFTSKEIAQWAVKNGYDVSPRSVGNTLARLEIFDNKSPDEPPAVWALNPDDNEDARKFLSDDAVSWLFGEGSNPEIEAT